MTESTQKQELQIGGMSCGHCRAAVESAIREVPGVTAVQVDLERGKATVEGAADLQSLVGAVQEAGYEATPAGSR